MSPKKVIIVGAGPGGLTAAMLLAHRGYQVTVFEKEQQVGGRNAPLRLGPYVFDTGPTFLMMPFILRQVFEEAGRKLEDYCELIELDPLYKLSFPDFSFFPTTDSLRMSKELARVFPGNQQGFAQPGFARIPATFFSDRNNAVICIQGCIAKSAPAPHNETYK